MSFKNPCRIQHFSNIPRRPAFHRRQPELSATDEEAKHRLRISFDFMQYLQPMANHALETRRWLRVSPNREHPMVADQIRPLHTIGGCHLGCLNVAEHPMAAHDALHQFHLLRRVPLNTP